MKGESLTMARDLYFNTEHLQVRSAVNDFINKEINPYIDEWEEKGLSPLHELFKKMGDLGFLGIRYDPKYGGEGLDYWYETAFLEALGNIECGGIPMAITVQTNHSTPAIAEFGSEYLKETYLKPAIRGDMVAAIAITEPGAGSDVSALTTRAVRDGDSYIINGAKTFITNGAQADFLTLLARTSDRPGNHSFGLFVVPTNLPGFVVSRKLDKLGMRCSDTAELFFDNLRVPADNLIGEEGEGFIYQMKQFQHERFSALPRNYVFLRNIIDWTVEHLKTRVVFGKPLITKQVLRHRIAQWLTEIEAVKQLTYHIVRMKMAGMDATKEISMGKLLVGQLTRRVTDGCLQMYGGLGYMSDTKVSRFFRDLRVVSIGGGANEVMCEIISKQEGLI